MQQGQWIRFEQLCLVFLQCSHMKTVHLTVHFPTLQAILISLIIFITPRTIALRLAPLDGYEDHDIFFVQ